MVKVYLQRFWFVAAIATVLARENAIVVPIFGPDAQVYTESAEVLSKSLTAVGECLPRIAMVERALPYLLQRRLEDAGFIVRRAHLDSAQVVQLQILAFNMTEYRQVLFLHADTLVLRPLEGMFQRDISDIAAAPEIHSPDRFNSGVMVIRPSHRAYSQLQERLHATRSPYDADSFFNDFFPDWFVASPSHRLPLADNLPTVLSEVHPPSMLQIMPAARIVHFWRLGDESQKPWDGVVTRKEPHPAVVYWHALWAAYKVAPAGVDIHSQVRMDQDFRSVLANLCGHDVVANVQVSVQGG